MSKEHKNNLKDSISQMSDKELCEALSKYVAYIDLQGDLLLNEAMRRLLNQKD